MPKCLFVGHPDLGAPANHEIRARQAELNEILAKHLEVEFAEADSIMYPATGLPVMMTKGLESETTNVNVLWGLDRIDERQRTTATLDNSPSLKKGTGVRTRFMPSTLGFAQHIKSSRAEQSPHWKVTGQCSRFVILLLAKHLELLDKYGKSGMTTMIIKAMDSVISNALKPAVISMSLGGATGGGTWYEFAVDKAVEAVIHRCGCCSGQ